MSIWGLQDAALRAHFANFSGVIINNKRLKENKRRELQDRLCSIQANPSPSDESKRALRDTEKFLSGLKQDLAVSRTQIEPAVESSGEFEAIAVPEQNDNDSVFARKAVGAEPDNNPATETPRAQLEKDYRVRLSDTKRRLNYANDRKEFAEQEVIEQINRAEKEEKRAKEAVQANQQLQSRITALDDQLKDLLSAQTAWQSRERLKDSHIRTLHDELASEKKAFEGALARLGQKEVYEFELKKQHELDIKKAIAYIEAQVMEWETTVKGMAEMIKIETRTGRTAHVRRHLGGA